MMSLSTHCHLLQPKKTQRKTTTSWEAHHPFLDFMFLCFFLFFFNSKKQQEAKRLVVIFWVFFWVVEDDNKPGGLSLSCTTQ
jgi:hypothetical protein